MVDARARLFTEYQANLAAREIADVVSRLRAETQVDTDWHPLGLEVSNFARVWSSAGTSTLYRVIGATIEPLAVQEERATYILERDL